MEFQAFPKMARLSRDIVVTEKIDGTNGQIVIVHGLVGDTILGEPVKIQADETGYLLMYVGSRNRWIKPGDDNFGFASWCSENSDELFKLGEGRHFGEWWGYKIGRGYGLDKDDRRFSLFNTYRWSDPEVRPACCSVVPLLYEGPFEQDSIECQIERLRFDGSRAAPGFLDPEGIVVFHTAANIGFKKTIKDDESPKSALAYLTKEVFAIAA